MKHALPVLAACCSLWCGAAAAGETNPYNAYFQEALDQCQTLAKFNPQTDASGSYFSAEHCYAWQSQLAYEDNPQARDQYLTAALQVAPQYAEETFAKALDVGLDRYHAVTLATAAYPKAEATYAQLAITRGADPTKVTQATAAGRKK